MSAPPRTVLQVSPEEEAAIRAAVRSAGGPAMIIAGPEHVAGLTALLADPKVSDPIYDLPRPINETNVGRWVEESEALRQKGECLLTVSLDEAGEVAGYSRFTVWPDRSAAEIAGARRADRQNSHGGKAGVARSIAFMFENLGVRLIALTAALDNVRSAASIDAAGFRRMGEIDSVRPDGTTRRSLYWELTREEWVRTHRL
ncbi:RimJ/RimL family protein N-acetyltransferase [Phenylobacterium haematophilum]|uniref:RimJ/RimL family protein N-acetyltransferase n=1 Tax=Phenylobacterium haematophilum TaxID=98513 RepID=A0A839ZYX0_9CAUL|nr:GNAT family protein [Phenylobacterium haematophilum]MBB3891348.1 RimJ/RimL family protein N-acetyltransferase [Phenylobacterium haematophilum]